MNLPFNKILKVTKLDPKSRRSTKVPTNNPLIATIELTTMEVETILEKISTKLKIPKT
jgi:hypothetical protein